MSNVTYGEARDKMKSIGQIWMRVGPMGREYSGDQIYLLFIQFQNYAHFCALYISWAEQSRVAVFDLHF